MLASEGVTMPMWLAPAVRTGLQSAWGLLAAWAVARGVDVPQDPPVWLEGLALAGATSAVTAAVHAAEHRGGVLGVLGRILVAGIPPRAQERR